MTAKTADHLIINKFDLLQAVREVSANAIGVSHEQMTDWLWIELNRTAKPRRRPEPSITGELQW